MVFWEVVFMLSMYDYASLIVPTRIRIYLLILPTGGLLLG